MALFEGNKRKPGTTSNTKLIVSGGDSPAERWKVNPELPQLFEYLYGGAGQTDVIVAKGMMVAIDKSAPLVRDYTNNRFITQITLADGTNPVIGMAPYNFAREVDDRFTGNQPSIITKEYVELPYFPSKEDAKLCLWGSVSGAIEAGDLVKVSSDAALKGRLEKWIEGTDKVTQICGQVLAKEPAGSDYDFLEWVMWDARYKNEDDSYMNRTGYSAPGLEGYPFDPEIYNKNGFTTDNEGYLSQYTTNPTGVPGITDGAMASNTLLTRSLGVIAQSTAIGTVVSFYVQPNLIPGELSFKVAGVKIEESDENLIVDYKRGFVKYVISEEVVAEQAVTVEYKAKQHGIPSHMNFNGADGVVRILLRF